MKNIFFAVIIMFSLATTVAAETLRELTLGFGRFGQLAICRNSEQPSQVMLLVSGRSGWDHNMEEMAKILTDLDALVVGIDLTTYLSNLKGSGEDCVYSAAEFESLSKFVQRKLGLSKYQIPILVGYSSGATFVYTVMVQAPYNTFRGAISLGFCPSLSMHPALCQSNGLAWNKGAKDEMIIQPFTGLAKPWIVIQGKDDLACNPDAAADFIKQVKNGRLITIPVVGRQFSAYKNWFPQFKDAFGEITAAEPQSQAENESLSGLPLVEVAARQPERDYLAVLLSGDGGWAGLDQQVSAGLAGKGIPVIGLSTLKYFWTSKSPETASKDLDRILRHYLDLWKKDRAVLMGYSFGADVLPFMVSRLPKDLSAKVALVVLLGISTEANFEFHLSDWLGGSDGNGRPTLPEVHKLSGTNLLCLYGTEESDSICPEISQPAAKAKVLTGGHHYQGNYMAIVDAIISDIDAQKQ